MKIFIGLLVLISATFPMTKAPCQRVISTAGGAFRGESFSLSYTIGEPLAQTYKSGSQVLTQGFLQPYNSYRTQILEIPQGWSGLSAYLDPMNKSVEKIFSPCSGDLVILQSMLEVYIPSMLVNTIGSWDYQEGYKIKVNNDINLTITGTKIANPKVNLPGGWRIMPVLSECPVNVEQLFEPASGNLRVVKEIAGLGIYWPEMGYNSIGNLWPGKAYFVLTNSPVEVTFGECMKGLVADETGNQMKNMAEISPWTLLQPTFSSHTIAILPGALSFAGTGTIIGLFDQNGNCHSIHVNDSETGYFTAFGNDPYTSGSDGFEENEPFLFKIFNTNDGTGYQAEAIYDQSLDEAGEFTQNGLSVITGFKALGSLLAASDLMKITVYPNPSDSDFNIRLSNHIRGVKWSVTGAFGNAILTGTSQDNDFTINLSTQPKGIYYLTVNIGGLQTVRKLVKH